MIFSNLLALVNPKIYSAPFAETDAFGVAAITGSFLWPILILILGLWLGRFVVRSSHPEDRQFLWKLFLAAFWGRIALTIFLYLFSITIHGDYPGFFVGDGHCYFVNGSHIAKIWQMGAEIVDLESFGISSRSGNVTPYDFWNARIYYITGPNPFNMFFMNCFFGALTSIVIYCIVKHTLDVEVARLSALFAAFWPSIMLWSTQNLKDPLLLLLVCAILLMLLNLRHKFKITYLLMIVPPFLILKYFQNMYLVIIFVLTVPAWLFFSSKLWLKHKRRIIITAIIVTVIFGLPIYKGIKWFATAKGLFFLDPEQLLAIVVKRRKGAVMIGRLAILHAGLDIDTIPKALKFLPTGLVYSWFAPFPWQTGSFAQISAIPETIVFYCLVPWVIRGLLYAIKNKWRESSMLIIFIAVMTVLLALLEANTGTLFRHRAILMYFLLTFASLWIVERRRLKLKRTTLQTVVNQ